PRRDRGHLERQRRRHPGHRRQVARGGHLLGVVRPRPAERDGGRPQRRQSTRQPHARNRHQRERRRRRRRRGQRARHPPPPEREVRPPRRHHHEEGPDRREPERQEARAVPPRIGPQGAR